MRWFHGLLAEAMVVMFGDYRSALMLRQSQASVTVKTSALAGV
jgi:hypothetical protein